MMQQHSEIDIISSRYGFPPQKKLWVTRVPAPKGYCLGCKKKHHELDKEARATIHPNSDDNFLCSKCDDDFEWVDGKYTLKMVEPLKCQWCEEDINSLKYIMDGDNFHHGCAIEKVNHDDPYRDY